MAGNVVTLTFAGEEKGLTDSFDRVGGSAKKMGEDVGRSGEGFRRAGEAADNVDTKAMGFRDTLTGVQDSMKGASLIAKGDLFNGFLTLGMGVGDLGSGFYNFLIPALEKTKIATLAQAAAGRVSAAAARTWGIAQRFLNISLFASPITWIILGIVALIAVIVLIARRTDWFQRAWRNSWAWIKNAAQNTWEFIKKIPGWLQSAFSRVAGWVSAPFKSAFNAIARAWNATVGGLSFSIPSWVPFIGGNSFSVPRLRTFHSGGVVPGVAGTPVPVLALAGERVSSPAARGGDGETWVRVDLGDLGDALLEPISRAVGKRGGRATALGVRVLANGTVR